MSGHPKASAPCGFKHLLFGWFFFLCGLGATFGPVVLLIHLLMPDRTRLPPSGWVLLFLLFAALCLIFLLVMASVKAFLRLWFWYLKALKPGDRLFAETSLRKGLNVNVLEPQYSRMRKRHLGSDNV